VDGQAYPLPRPLAFAGALISGQRRFEYDALAEERQRGGFVDLLCEFHNKGYLHFP
jgi:hypothetical protein